MVAGTHPDDIDLFEYVEDDLPAARRAEIQAHLSTCSACSEQVARVEAGREALHGAQFMHLPAKRAEAVFMNLPTSVREPGRRRRALTPKQLIAVLTPVIAIAAVVAVLVNSGQNSGSGSAAGTGVGGAGAAAATSEDATRSPTPSAEAFQANKLSASGTATDIAAELRSKGFDAVVQRDKVVVKGSTKKAVREALADRGSGSVQIVVTGR